MLIDGRMGMCLIFCSRIGVQKFNFCLNTYQKTYFTIFYASHFNKENWSGPLFLYLIYDLRENVSIEDESDIDQIDSEVKKALKVRWRKHFQKYINMDVEERKYRTMINNLPPETLLQVMDIIVSEEIEEIEQQHNMTLWTLNVIYYTTALTLLEHEGVKRRTQTREKPG